MPQGVERHGGEASVVVGFPLVDLAVAVSVFFRTDQRALLVVLRPGHLAVAGGRKLDPRDRSVGRRIGPAVFFAAVGPREANLLELLPVVVILPAVDLAVPVLIDLDPHDPRAVHVAPGIHLAGTLRVVLEELQLAGRLVILGRDPLAGVALAKGLARTGAKSYGVSQKYSR